MTNYAYNSVKESYDIDTLREIVEYGCSGGSANQHIYYSQTIAFFDEHEDEIVEYIADILGDEYNEELWNNNPCHITGYKNDTTWCYIELVASQIVAEYEDTTCQELSDESYDILTSNKEVRELVTS